MHGEYREQWQILIEQLAAQWNRYREKGKAKGRGLGAIGDWVLLWRPPVPTLPVTPLVIVMGSEKGQIMIEPRGVEGRVKQGWKKEGRKKLQLQAMTAKVARLMDVQSSSGHPK